MMTLDETIKHCEKEAEKNEEMCRIEEVMGLGLQNTEMMKYAKEHKQLAEWLKELKQFKEQEPCDDCISRQAVLETIDNRIEQIKRDANEINKSYSHLSFAEGIHDGYCRLKCDLRILSSVKPQPKSEVLDKIRDEIERKAHSGQWSDATMYGMLKAVAIIDKYKVESEQYVPDINVGNINCILNKIRHEIESCREDEEPHLVDYRYYRNEGLDMALDIIDNCAYEKERIKRCDAESEEEDGD